jgi:hypothetical protein
MISTLGTTLVLGALLAAAFGAVVGIEEACATGPAP